MIEEPMLVSIDEIRKSVNSISLSDNLIISSDFESMRITSGFPVKVDGIIISICLEGSIQLTIGMKKYKIQKNDMMFILPGNIIKTMARSDDFDSVSMIFSRDNLMSIHIDIPSMLPTMLSIKENPIKRLTEREIKILMEYSEIINSRSSAVNGINRNEIVHHLLMALFFEISNFYSVALELQKNKSRKDVIFEQFNNLVLQHHKESRSVTFYAQKLFITPKHLSFVVKEVTGKTAVEWIDTCIILESMSLLKFSDMTVKQVSTHLNFPNQSFFSKFFKRHTNMSPSQYKAK